MRLLDRYLLRELSVPLAYCLSGFLVFWISFNLFSRLGEFQDKHLKGKEVLEYYIVTTPEMLGFVLPIALLLALLYALTSHARHHELTAIRAAGVSMWRLSLPYFGVGIFLSVALFFINEFWVPRSEERADEILDKRAPQRDWQEHLFFRNERENRSWTIAAYNFKTHEMSKPNVRWDLPDGSFRDFHAEQGVYTNGFWNFLNVQEVNGKSRQDSFPQIIMRKMAILQFSETPELIRSETRISNLDPKKAAKRAQIPLRDILNYLRLHPVLSEKQSETIHTQLQGRLAAPWTCLIVVLIALPFGAPSGRRNVFVGVASSIFICFAYFILLQLGLSLGTGGKLSPWLAAWLPNILFGGAGIFLTARLR